MRRLSSPFRTVAALGLVHSCQRAVTVSPPTVRQAHRFDGLTVTVLESCERRMMNWERGPSCAVRRAEPRVDLFHNSMPCHVEQRRRRKLQGAKATEGRDASACLDCARHDILRDRMTMNVESVFYRIALAHRPIVLPSCDAATAARHSKGGEGVVSSWTTLYCETVLPLPVDPVPRQRAVAGKAKGPPLARRPFLRVYRWLSAGSRGARSWCCHRR